jgi:enoyl-CoA hydratase/carnithine racemase
MNVNEPGVDLSVDGVVATVLLNRPDVRNAQHPAMWSAIASFLESLPDEVRVVVVRGAGGTFSAGLDLSLVDPGQTEVEGSLVATLARSDEEVVDLIDEYQRPFVALADPRFISIAVIDGYAIGAGFQMALACDLRIMAEDAWVCMKEPALGLVPDLAGTKPLVDAVGYSRALEICATARKVGAHEAERIGLAQSVVPAVELDPTLTDLIAALVAHDATAVRNTHELLAAASSRSLDEQRLAERTAQVGRLRAALGR